jgi:hypothetical protein
MAQTQVLMVGRAAVGKAVQVITAVHQQTQYLERLTQVQAAAVVAAHLRQHWAVLALLLLLIPILLQLRPLQT